MMKRFSRKRRSSAEGRARVIEGSQWLPKVLEAGILDAKGIEPAQPSDVPDSIAAIGRGERADGSEMLVSFSPRSATEALLGGLAAAQQAAEDSNFSGTVFVVAPGWPAGARRVLSLLGQTPFSIEPIAAPGLADARMVVEAEPEPPVLATGYQQLAARMISSESRAAFTRAAAALEGLAAKHGGTVRAAKDRLELVVLARRAAEIRTDGDRALLETQLGGRSSTPLTGADLAGALDGLEGQIRRRLNDHKVREGEEGLRGRVVSQLSAGSELRGLCAWPQPGTDLDPIDAVAVNESGEPVVVAVREVVEWTTLAAVLESISPLSALFPVLFAQVGPPLRLGPARLLFVGERFAKGLERALSSLILAFELRAIAGTKGPSVDLVERTSGEGAEAPMARRSRRRGGRSGRSSSSDSSDASDNAEDDRTSTAPVRTSGPTGLPIPTGPRADLEASAATPSKTEGRSDRDDDDDSTGEGDDAGRGRSRRRRRPRRGRRQDSESSEDLEASAAQDSPNGEKPNRAKEDAGDQKSGGDGSRRHSRQFEEISLMDLDDGASASEVESGSSAAGAGRATRGRRRSRRSGGGGDGKGEGRGERGRGSDDDDADGKAEAAPRVEEEDLVDSDDLEEILARLADSGPDELESEESVLSYEDEEEIEDDADGRPDREKRRRAGSGDAGSDEERPASRRRAAIVVHADRDSVIAALLLARDIRQVDGMWVYPQSELMTFFRSIATDLRDDTPIILVGFSPSPARDVIQAAALYRGRMTWFDRQAWPPEDRMAMSEALGADAIHGGVEIDSSLPLVLESSSRRSRFSDKLVDLATGRFTQHDFERWGRLWWWRLSEIAKKTGDIRAEIAPILSGRPSDLTKEAALIEVPPIPEEVAFVAAADFRLVHFGGHVMVVVPVEEPFDLHLSARIARERYAATLSLAYRAGGEAFVFTGDEMIGKRALDYLAVVEHLVNKLEWVEGLPDGDHVARFRVRDFAAYPERLEELMGEIAMGRTLLER